MLEYWPDRLSDLRDYGADDQRLWVDAAGRLMRPGSCDNAGAIVVCKQGVTGSSPVGSTPSQGRFALALLLYFRGRTAEVQRR